MMRTNDGRFDTYGAGSALRPPGASCGVTTGASVVGFPGIKNELQSVSDWISPSLREIRQV